MAKLQAYDSVDMSDFRSSIGEVAYYDKKTVIIESSSGYYATYYTGKFSYDDDEWDGTIKSISTYADDVLSARISGLKLDTRYATTETSVDQAYRVALAHDDDLRGSDFMDYLAGYAGDDAIRGNGGRDVLHGMSGRDKLYGGSDRDNLWGGAGNDALYGGAGADALRGGAGRDRLQGGSGDDAFIFYDDDGADRIADFEDGADVIRILDGAEDYADIRVGSYGDDVKIVYADTVILLEDTERRAIDAADFTFS